MTPLKVLERRALEFSLAREISGGTAEVFFEFTSVPYFRDGLFCLPIKSAVACWDLWLNTA